MRNKLKLTRFNDTRHELTGDRKFFIRLQIFVPVCESHFIKITRKLPFGNFALLCKKIP